MSGSLSAGATVRLMDGEEEPSTASPSVRTLRSYSPFILTCADVLAAHLPRQVCSRRRRRLTALVLLLHLSLSLPLLPLIPCPSPLSFFNPFCPTLPPPLHFLRPLSPSLSISPPSLSLSLSHNPSLARSLSSFHAALGLPKRLGLNGENLLWYNELGERQRGGGRNGGGMVGWGVLDWGGGSN